MEDSLYVKNGMVYFSNFFQRVAMAFTRRVGVLMLHGYPESCGV